MPNRTPLEYDLDDHLGAVREIIARTSPEALVKGFASLTHRIHANANDTASPSARAEVERDLRAQRELVEAEMMRRMQPFTVTDVQMNRAAQAAYDTKLVHIPAMTDKPRVVSMVRDILIAVGVPASGLPTEEAPPAPRRAVRDAPQA